MLQESQKEAESIALRAVEIARDHRHEMATLEHVLAALLETPEVQSCLGSLNVNAKELSDIMDHFLTGNFIEVTNRPGPPTKTASFETLFVRAIATAVFSPRKIVTPVDLLMHLSQFPHEDSYAVTALMRANVSTLMLKKYLAHGTPAASSNGRNHEAVGPEGMPVSEAEPNNREEAITFIRKYAANLNELAADGKIDPVIGRATELDQTIQILARRTKNNVIFTGDPGVGKSAICEGLAYKIVKNEVPTLIKNATVWSLDVGSLVAGTRFRGDLEERLKLFLKALTFLSEPTPNTDPASPDIAILFIDEIHTIMEAGSGSKGSLDVSNMLKPALAKGTLRCIGSTTYEEYRKHFEKDRALARRFKKVAIDEPSPELTKAILRGLRKLYENYHHVTFTDEALDAAVDLTHRYVHTALLPDKAIDIIDQAGARQRITPEDERLVVIDVPEIEIEVAKIVKFPPKEISEGEAAKLSRLEDDLKSEIFGQPKALKALNEAVMISRAGLREMNLTAGAYLFAGPTGVGKTQTARQLAKTLGIPLIKFDMSEYMERHSVSKLIGAPPGYVGFGDGAAGDGLLVNAVETNPSCVLLLDEVEKAHEDLFNVLLQIMDDAKLTNSQGKTVKFNNVILIMTTNAGVDATETSAIGFGRANDDNEIDEKAIKRLFRPEFRNRLDAMITFDRLKPENMIRIVDKFLANLSILAGNKNVVIEASDEAREWLSVKGYDRVFGARPLTRVIDEHIKKPLSREMLFGELANGGTARITLENDSLHVNGKKAN